MEFRIAVLLASLAMISCAFSQEHASPVPKNAVAGQQGKIQSPEKIWMELMEGNKRFVSGKTKVHEVVQLRKNLTAGQHPKAVVLTCSDSRVPPELLFDKSLGELFVIRSAGNIADAVGLGSIEYAVEHLHSNLVVVLGHSKCGAVTAACAGEKMPSENLQAIVDKINPAVLEARNYVSGDTLLQAAIEENIHQSAKDLLSNSAVLRHALKEGKITILEAVYSLETGQVSRLGKLSIAAPAYKLDVGDVVRGD